MELNTEECVKILRDAITSIAKIFNNAILLSKDISSKRSKILQQYISQESICTPESAISALKKNIKLADATYDEIFDFIDILEADGIDVEKFDLPFINSVWSGDYYGVNNKNAIKKLVYELSELERHTSTIEDYNNFFVIN